MVGHPVSVKSKILNYFKFPPLTKLIEKTKIPKIWRSSLFSLELCFFSSIFVGFQKQNWDFVKVWPSILTYVLNFMLSVSKDVQQTWLVVGKVNCKIFEKSSKKRKCILFRIFNQITFFNPNSLRRRLKRKTVNLFPSNSRSTAFKAS